MLVNNAQELANDIKVRCLVARRRMLSFDSTNRYKHQGDRQPRPETSLQC